MYDIKKKKSELFILKCQLMLFFPAYPIDLAEKLTRRDFDVSMTSCHHYQENEENLHK